MKKEITLVPMDKCPIDAISELGDQCRNAWIFLHPDVVYKLEKNCDKNEELAHCIRLTWSATTEYPETIVIISNNQGEHWHRVLSIKADDIKFKDYTCDPDYIFFLKMDV